MHQPTPRLLFVDDDPAVLRQVATLLLHSEFSFHSAFLGVEGISLLQGAGPFAAVVCARRLPDMVGLTFLRRAHAIAPDTSLLLVAGPEDFAAVVAAANEVPLGGVLQAPYTEAALHAALARAVLQYEQRHAARLLDDQLTHGSVQAILELLEMTRPDAAHRAQRLKTRVQALAVRLKIEERWPLEAAAALSQLCCLSLSPELLDKIHAGGALHALEKAAQARGLAAAARILRHIPRLNVVSWILAHSADDLPPSGPHPVAALGAKLLHFAIDLEALHAQGLKPRAALDALRGRARYDASLLDAQAAIIGEEEQLDVRELSLRELREGMRLVQDLRLKSGLLLAASGYELTHSFVERSQEYLPGTISEPIRVLVPRHPTF